MEKYTVETVYPYRFYHSDNLPDARQKQKELKRQKIKSFIVVQNAGGNDCILAE